MCEMGVFLRCGKVSLPEAEQEVTLRSRLRQLGLFDEKKIDTKQTPTRRHTMWTW